MQILYRRHLHIELSNSKNIDKFAFCDPNPAFKLNADFEDYIVERLAKGDADRIFFLPHNHKYVFKFLATVSTGFCHIKLLFIKYFGV